MRLIYVMTAAAIGLGSFNGLVKAEDKPTMTSETFYKSKLTKAEAIAYLKAEEIALLPDNLPAKVMTGDVDAVEAMVVAGLDLKAPGPIPQSPLEMAAQTCSMKGHVKISDTLRMIDLFIGGGVDPNHAGIAGMTALIVAAQQQCPPVVINHLLAAGAKIDARTPQGFTALSMALIVANYEGAEALIQAGARLSPEAGEKFLTGTDDDDPRLVELVKRASQGK